MGKMTVRLIDANAIRGKAVPHTRGEYGYCADIRKWAVLVGDIDDAPTIEAEPVRHGRWIISSDGYYPYCSECKEEPKSGNMTKYCPNCGSKMDKEE